MDPVILARVQFAITTVYHFFFVPLTLGLSILVALMETLYVGTGKDIYKQMTKFWGKLFLVNFAMGVVTGIVQEFQFGMNWSEYSRFVGDIFGAPLAVEALLAFFLESTFLGVWVFGWERISKKVHMLVIWLVAIGSNLSAFWILVANAFMQQPVGYILRNGRAEMTDFFALLFNPTLQVMFPHTVLAGMVTAAFFLLGISAYHLARKQHTDFFQRSFQIGAIAGSIAIALLILNGHSQAQHMVAEQPMKMAAAEALWTSEDPASFSLITIGDLSQRADVFAIRIPAVLSLLAYNRPNGEVKGIYNLQAEYEQTYGPGSYIPPIAVTYWSFRLMVGAGFAMLALALFTLYLWRTGFQKFTRLLPLLTWAIALPYLANTTGWLMTELGRAPWIVFGLMKISDGISKAVTGGEVLLTLIGFTLVYGALMAADVYLLAKFARNGPRAPGSEAADSAGEASIPLVGV